MPRAKRCASCGKTVKELEKEYGCADDLLRCIGCKRYFCCLCVIDGGEFGCPECSNLVPCN